MKLNKYITAAALLCACAGAQAQNTYSGYFADGYEYRFRMNPAMGNDSTSFVSVPGVANLNVGMRGNLHVKDVIYNVGGKTTTFLNPGVSAAEVMGNLSNTNRINADVNVTLLAGGFKAWGGYNTVSINARAGVNARLPKELFRLLKEGITNDSYDISDVRARARAYAEIAFGHSRDINKQWRVGGSLKFLLGVADLDARFNRARLTLGTDSWDIEANADMRASMKGFRYKQELNDRTGREYVSGIDIDGPGINGFGLALDLGGVFTLNKDWQFSAAVLDFGFISYANDILATTGGTRTFKTDKYTFNVDDDAPNSFKSEWDVVRDDLEELYQLEDAGDQGGRTRMLAATINLGARYTFPLYRPLTFGLVNTTRIDGKYTWTDFRLSANVAPVKMFSASANLAVGTYGVGFGWMLNYHYTGFGLFLGMDHTLGKVTKEFVPLSSNAQVNFGMNILF